MELSEYELEILDLLEVFREGCGCGYGPDDHTILDEDGHPVLACDAIKDR